MDGVTKLAPPRGEGALDLEAIRALEDALGPQESAELIDDRILEATDRLVAIEMALDEECWTRVAKAARDLARLAARAGMPALAEQAEALDDCCRCLDRIAAHAVGARVLRTGEAMLSASLFRPGAG
jgi:HPt (histidine-containing phosphotransfer) domain-containing protein